jgi:haloacetate dehalogenase
MSAGEPDKTEAGTSADLFPGFDARTFDTGEAEIFARIGGKGPPLLMLHGYPQCHVMWHRIAAALAESFTCVIADLRGYGASSVPASRPDHEPYSKRAMARDMVAVMAQLGFDRFALAGHDRGGRVGYRLALDHGERVSRLAVLDIVPTHAMWHDFTVRLAMKTYHWLFLAQPEPLPETLIGAVPDYYLDTTIASWTKDNSLAAFDLATLDRYRQLFRDPARLHAACEDYRAGQSFDLAADEADVAAGRRIACPVFVLWGKAGIPGGSNGGEDGPLATWRNWAGNVDGAAIDAGHFVCEENPQATLAALLPFLRQGR